MGTGDQSAVASPVAKLLSVWALLGVTSWAEAASAVAAIYTSLLILEWLFNKFLRGCLERRGWIKPRHIK